MTFLLPGNCLMIRLPVFSTVLKLALISVTNLRFVIGQSSGRLEGPRTAYHLLLRSMSRDQRRPRPRPSASRQRRSPPGISGRFDLELDVAVGGLDGLAGFPHQADAIARLHLRPIQDHERAEVLQYSGHDAGSMADPDAERVRRGAVGLLPRRGRDAPSRVPSRRSGIRSRIADIDRRVFAARATGIGVLQALRHPERGVQRKARRLRLAKAPKRDLHRRAESNIRSRCFGVSIRTMRSRRKSCPRVGAGADAVMTRTGRARPRRWHPSRRGRSCRSSSSAASAGSTPPTSGS